jgi:uncharacterized protein YcbX
MPTAARFNLTPVKSTALQHPNEIVVSELGVEGDHRFMFLEADGTRPSTAAKASLLSLRTSYDPAAGTLSASFPDGWAAVEDISVRGVDVRVALYDREVIGQLLDGPVADALSARLGRPIHLVRIDEPEYAGGRHRISMVSLASVRDLGRRGGLDGDGPDPRRFRMSVELDGCEPYEEDSWKGQPVRLGEVVVQVGDGVSRCALTTMHPETGEKDFDTLRVLGGYRKRGTELLFGVYADVVEPGRIRVGDLVEPL